MTNLPFDCSCKSDRARARHLAAWNVVHGYADPPRRILPDIVPVDLDTEPRESFLAPRRIGAGAVSTTILVILVFVALCTLAAVRMS